MDVVISIILLVVGLFFVIKGADYLVDGASSLAFKYGVPALVVGLTIVSFGTSAPELVVSIISAIKGNTQASFGNVIWSNLFNTLVILGVTAFFVPLKVKSSTVWKEIPFALLAAVSVLLLGFAAIINDGSIFVMSYLQKLPTPAGELGISQWLVLIALFIIFMYYTFGLTKSSKKDIQEESIDVETSEDLPTRKVRTYILLWLVALVWWWQLAVDNAVSLAQMIWLSDKIIGLTILSVGTSLPELVTSIKAARKWQSDIAIWNVIGSNIFNVFWILGVVALIRPIPLENTNILDVVVLIAVTILTFSLIFIRRKFVIEKFEWAILILVYIAYITFLLMQ